MSHHSEYLLRKFHEGYTKGSDAECWEWSKGKQTNGYGVLWDMPRRPVTAHRMALEIKLGRPIKDGLFSLHKCDNRACVNPSHLREGTPKDNVDDMIARNRHSSPPVSTRHGVSSHMAKLTNETARSLLWARVTGRSYSSLSAEFGITAQTVAAICTGHTWSHLIGTPGYPTLTDLKAVPNNPFRRKHYTYPPRS